MRRLPMPTRPGVRALFAGLMLAAVISGGLVGERLSGGALRAGALANAAVTLTAVLALVFVHERDGVRGGVIVAELVGATVGVLAVHVALTTGWIARPDWLSERPEQFVNDFAAVSATLMIVWATARRLDVRWLVAALCVAGVYRATSRYWHLDAAPHGFVIRVQDLVVAQLVAVAFALPLFRWARAT